jgi:hypothetical protein
MCIYECVPACAGICVCAWVCGYAHLVLALYEDPTSLRADNCTYIYHYSAVFRYMDNFTENSVI